MPIRAHLLNKTVDLESESATKNVSGDFGGGTTTLQSGVKMRIARNEKFGSGNIESQGVVVTSTHIGLTDGDETTDPKQGDYVIDGSKKYLINYIDREPGGTKSGDKLYHWEYFLSLQN